MSETVKPWIENSSYPGRHWLLYTDRGDYVARVDHQPYDKGLYRWTAFMYREDLRQYGFAKTLENAQQTAQRIVEGKPVQMMLTGMMV